MRLVLMGCKTREAVGILPYFSVDDCRVESVKDAQRQRDALDNSPRKESVEIDLHGIRLHLLHLKCVDEPQSQVADEEESNRLSARLGSVLFHAAYSPTRHV